MKGSDKVAMTLNIGGELIKLDVKFDDQNIVRDAEREVKLYLERLRKAWPDNSDRNLLAMAAYQFASWYLQLLKIQEEAIDITRLKCKKIDEELNPDNSELEDSDQFLA